MANIHLNSYKTPNDFQYNQIKTWFVLTFHFEVPVTFASVAVVVSQSKTNFRLAQWKLNTVQDVGAETRSGVVQTGHSFQTTKHNTFKPYRQENSHWCKHLQYIAGSDC